MRWVSNTVHVRTLSMMNLIMYNQLNNKPQLYTLLLLSKTCAHVSQDRMKIIYLCSRLFGAGMSTGSDHGGSTLGSDRWPTEGCLTLRWFADGTTQKSYRRNTKNQRSQKIRGSRIFPFEAFVRDIFIDFPSLQSLSEIQGHSKDKANRNKKANSSANVAAKVFSRYDVVETSYHFYSDRIDLHLCDDPGGSKCSFITYQGSRLFTLSR